MKTWRLSSEQLFWNQNEPDVLTDEITTIDNALTRPWTVNKKYVRRKVAKPDWFEEVCTEDNSHVGIAGEVYYLSADGRLMPAKKDQAPPDLRYFKRKCRIFESLAAGLAAAPIEIDCCRFRHFKCRSRVCPTSACSPEFVLCCARNRRPVGLRHQ